MYKEIVFVTSHSQKAEQLGLHLNFPVRHQAIDLSEAQSLDLEEVAVQKARQAYELVKSPVLVEDISFRFAALGRLPGPLIKWFLQELGVKGLCHLLDGYDDRGVLGEVCFALHDGVEVHVFDGSIEGTVAEFPRGKEGFGMDSIFIPCGSQKTWGEMDEAEWMPTSMRRIALKKLETFLSQTK